MGKRAIEFCLTEYGRGQVEQNQAMVRFMSLLPMFVANVANPDTGTLEGCASGVSRVRGGSEQWT